MNQHELVAELKRRVAAVEPTDRFSLMQTLKDAARAILSQFEDLNVEDVIKAAQDAYDQLIGPIDLPGPDPLWDQMIKSVLGYGIRQAWELLQKDA